MGQHVRVALVAGVMALAGCGRKPPRAEPLRPPTPAPSVAPSADYYDRDGNIKGSGKRYEWLELPVTFTRSTARSVGGHEVWESDRVPLDKVCDYLSRRMFTGNVERSPNSARYPGAMPLDMDAAARRLTVSVTQTAGMIQIDIEALPRVSEVKPLSEEEARQLLSQERERIH